eukprot:4998259-Amphidinium_carterae.1
MWESHQGDEPVSIQWYSLGTQPDAMYRNKAIALVAAAVLVDPRTVKPTSMNAVQSQHAKQRQCQKGQQTDIEKMKIDLHLLCTIAVAVFQMICKT